MDELQADAQERLKHLPVPRAGEDGYLLVPDPGTCLAVARQGKSDWQIWTGHYGSDGVSFSGVDFTRPENANIDFTDFAFGDDVDFSGCQFGDGPAPAPAESDEESEAFKPGMARFAGAVFGDRANFSNAVFGAWTVFSGWPYGHEAAVFGEDANFSGAHFGYGANLRGVQFAGRTNFSGATFGDSADCTCAVFGEHPRFSGISFGSRANLSGAEFGAHADFSTAVFGDEAKLSGTVFREGANLFGVTFGNQADLSGSFFGDRAVLVDANFRGTTAFNILGERGIAQLQELAGPLSRKQAEEFEKRVLDLLGRDPQIAFGTISFSRAEFADVANFFGRKFGGLCDFSDAVFSQPPELDGCEGTRRLNFYNAKIGFAGELRGRAILGLKIPPSRVPNWNSDSLVGLRLRTLRILAEDAKNHDLERDLYIEERKAERAILFSRYWREGWKRWPRLVGHCLWIAVMSGYWVLADYGRSFARPLVALAVSVPLFWWAYASVLIPPTDPAKLADFRPATSAFAISNAVPFVGALTLERDVKPVLFCGDRPIDKEHAKPGESVCVPIPGRRFQLLALGQSIFSALCIFFAGLALRNYFKLR